MQIELLFMAPILVHSSQKNAYLCNSNVTVNTWKTHTEIKTIYKGHHHKVSISDPYAGLCVNNSRFPDSLQK